MNVQLLIDSIVRQTTVLVAQLATSAGARAPLAHVANQVFLELVAELKDQGLGNKVIADMFGLALRTYHARIRRLSESKTYSGRSLWEAVLEYVSGKGTVLRAEVLRRFQYDDEATVRGVLRDLVESGMLFRTGKEDTTSYRAAMPEDYATPGSERTGDAAANMVWVAVSRYGPARANELLRVMAMNEEELGVALGRLLREERIEAVETETETLYRCSSCVIPVGATAGWEASVFDHFQAVVTAIVSKVRQGRLSAEPNDSVGGSTYTYDVWRGHPHRDEVLGFLRDVRAKAVALRLKVEAYNERLGLPGEDPERVIAYVGQTLLGGADDDPSD
jgi:hypothetical protein